MKILFISSFALFKESHFGGSKRLYYFVSELARNSDLHLVCFDGSREIKDYEKFTNEFPKSLFLPLGGRKSPWRKFNSVPIDISEEIIQNKESINNFLNGQTFDSTLLAYPLALSFLDHFNTNLMGKILYLEDDLLLETYRLRGEIDFRARKLLYHLKNKVRYHQLIKYYRARLKCVDLFIAISNQEAAIINHYFPSLPTTILKYGIPLQDYPTLKKTSADIVIGFIGNFDHTPNADAIDWLVVTIFPQLKTEFSNLKLVIAGRGIPRKVMDQCAGDPDIQVYENVLDLMDFYSSITIFINPIRIGRGLRTKLVEAAAYGRPIISTSLGAEGLENLSILIWRDIEDLISKMKELENSKRYTEIVLLNRSLVEKEYSTEVLGSQLLKLLTYDN